MRIWGLSAVAIALIGGLGVYRIVSLEQRVDALSSRMGHASANAAGTATRGPGLEQRLAKLEREVGVLRHDLQELEQAEVAPFATAPGADKTANENQILSVVGRAQNRIRDRQLQFHRDRWLESRESALDEFAQHFGLSSWQTEQLHRLLSDEVDGMVEILRRPEALENPEQAASEWQAKLEQTDNAARRVLEPAQVDAWDQARANERRTFWPWLPNK